jgi:hypothetical protein
MRRYTFEMTSAKKNGDGGGEGDSKKKFPWALHCLLEDAAKNGNDNIISWTPSGIAFKVHKRDDFMKQILPKYFRQTKFKSFVRQLNLWGFTFVDQGPDKGSCEFVLVGTFSTHCFIHPDTDALLTVYRL